MASTSWTPSSWRDRPAGQQPDWPDVGAFDQAVKTIATLALTFALAALREHHLPSPERRKRPHTALAGDDAQLRAAFDALTQRHSALVEALRKLQDPNDDPTGYHAETVAELLAYEPDPAVGRAPARRSDDALTFHLFGDGEEWFVRVADPDDGPRRVTVYYQQPGSTARYIVADSRHTDAGEPQPHRLGFIRELAELLVTVESGADFKDEVYLLLERHGHEGVYNEAYNAAHPDAA